MTMSQMIGNIFRVFLTWNPRKVCTIHLLRDVGDIWFLNSNIAKPQKFDDFHLVYPRILESLASSLTSLFYHFTIHLKLLVRSASLLGRQFWKKTIKVNKNLKKVKYFRFIWLNGLSLKHRLFWSFFFLEKLSNSINEKIKPNIFRKYVSNSLSRK